MDPSQLLQWLIPAVGALVLALGGIAAYEIKRLRDKLEEIDGRSKDFVGTQQVRRLADDLNDKERGLRDEIKEMTRELRSELRDARMGYIPRLPDTQPALPASPYPIAQQPSPTEVLLKGSADIEKSKVIKDKFGFLANTTDSGRNDV